MKVQIVTVQYRDLYLDMKIIKTEVLTMKVLTMKVLTMKVLIMKVQIKRKTKTRI